MEAFDFNNTSTCFLSWLSRIGVQINPKLAIVDMRHAGKNRGAIASAHIEENEVLFSIPRSAVLNVDTVRSDPYYSELHSKLADMPGWLALTSILLLETSRKDSNWSPYLGILPQRLDSLAFWSSDELSELQASTVEGKIGKNSAESLFTQHISSLNIENTDISACHRWASIIMAYAFDIPEVIDIAQQDSRDSQYDEDDELVSEHENDEKTILSMIPLADILNADAEKNNARLCCDNENLEMLAIRPIPQGHEIFNDYGQLPTSDLVRRYGFATANYALYDVTELQTSQILNLLSNNNSSNQVLSRLGLTPLNAIDLSKRVDLAQREGVYEDSYDIAHTNADGPSIPDELLALLYILLLDEDNLAAIEQAESDLPSRSKLSTILVGKLLREVLQARERQYSTTLEEDESILQAGNAPYRLTLAIRIRLGEKRVLREAMQATASFEASDKRLRISDEREAIVKGTKRREHEIGGQQKRARRT